MSGCHRWADTGIDVPGPQFPRGMECGECEIGIATRQLLSAYSAEFHSLVMSKLAAIPKLARLEGFNVSIKLKSNLCGRMFGSS